MKSLLLLGLLSFQLAPDPPGPIVHGPMGTVAAGDTLIYTFSWGPGRGATSYDVTYSVALSNGTWSLAADSNSGAGKWVPVAPLGPFPYSWNTCCTSQKAWLTAVPWDSATFTVTVTSRNSFGTSSPVSTTWRIARKPGPPGPITVDSSKIVTAILVRPQNATLAVGASRVLCAFQQFGNGAVTGWTADKPVCDSLKPSSIAPTAAQQAHTDSTAVTCVTWSSALPASVGIAAATCGAVTVTALAP